jgi:hypothetical protein
VNSRDKAVLSFITCLYRHSSHSVREISWNTNTREFSFTKETVFFIGIFIATFLVGAKILVFNRHITDVFSTGAQK